MRLHRISYYADFGVYAALVCALILVAAVKDDWVGRARWSVSFLLGAAVWTLLEYVVHRFALHHLPVVSEMHALHHASPRAYVGTPTWLSLTILLAAIFLPTWWAFSLNIASGLLAGVMAGFLWYGIVHHAVHYRRPRRLASRLTAARQRHLQHHGRRQDVNFGVTTGLWDRLFGTLASRG